MNDLLKNTRLKRAVIDVFDEYEKEIRKMKKFRGEHETHYMLEANNELKCRVYNKLLKKL